MQEYFLTSKWAEIINTHGSVGILWQAEEDFGFSPNPTEENEDLVKSIKQRQDILNETSLSSDVRYEVLFDYINTEHNCLSIVSIGDSQELHAFVAAATPKQYSQAELSGLLQPVGEYSVTYDDETKEVLGLVWDDNGEVFVRENGEWVSPTDEDERIYGGSLHYVSEDATELFDKLVQDKNAPTLESFKEVSLG
jgi:hypothetical protein